MAITTHTVILQICAVIGTCLTLNQECFFKSVPYRGHARTSSNNRPCRPWSDVMTSTDHATSRLPDKTLAYASNFCRDPDSKGHPWCHVWLSPHQTGWEYCDVPYCQECYYAGQTQNFSGRIADTGDNSTCDRWQDTNVTAVAFNGSQFPDASLSEAFNYCRDPLNRGHLYCSVNGSLKACTIPQCSGPCTDAGGLDCADLAVTADMCSEEYFSTILCPKTCGKCGFGLLPPVYKDPPLDTCRDNPDTDCVFMQRIICSNPDTARELCPRTCNVCVSDTSSPATASPDPSTTSGVTTPTYSAGVHFTSYNSTVSPRATTVTPKEDCVDSPDVNCEATSIMKTVCPNDVYARQFCRKTCGKCDAVAVNVTRNSCGDPVPIDMCPFLNSELCLCDDLDLRPALCPHYCAGECGPVMYGSDCGHPGLVG